MDSVINISTLPQKLQACFFGADHDKNQKIDTRKEARAAAESCCSGDAYRQGLCLDAQYYLKDYGYSLEEERALKLSIAPGVGLAIGGGPFRPDGLDRDTIEVHADIGLDFWQHVFMKYRLATAGGAISPLSHYLTVGFYPYTYSYYQEMHAPCEIPLSALHMQGQLPAPDACDAFTQDDSGETKWVRGRPLFDSRPREYFALPKKYDGLLVSVEVGAGLSKFTYDQVAKTATRAGLSAATHVMITQFPFPGGIEMGLRTNLFPGAYYEVLFETSFPFGIILHTKR
jgi:hypothetical protein